MAGFKFDNKGNLLSSVVQCATHPEVDLVAQSFQSSYNGTLYLLGVISRKPKQLLIDNPNLPPLTCRNEHELEVQYEKHVVYRSSQEMTRCDNCEGKMSPEELEQGYLRCDECNFDLCNNCSQLKVWMDAPRRDIPR